MSEGGRGTNLIRRVAVGVVAIPAILFIGWVGGWLFFILVAAIVVLGLLEFYRMTEAKGERPLTGLGAAGGVILCLGAMAGALTGALALLVVVVLTGTLFFRSRGETLSAAAVTLMGLVWVGWMGSHLVLLRELPGVHGIPDSLGARFVWLALALTWAGDTMAYAVGSLLGRHPLFPRVSPKKSVEGALGAVAGCLVMGEVARVWFAPFLSHTDVMILGLCVALISQLGDFAESMIKRDVGVKDASSAIPGHGGVLDRFDSMLFSAPFVFYYIRLFVLE